MSNNKTEILMLVELMARFGTLNIFKITMLKIVKFELSHN